ncbi:conserved hypothetical protein [Aspergillus fumigatus A1163]|uniref:Uncharacterized protein n=1 Tax=Aspergillus fumigatus (strain CBS 144.89 / FGSC A1163 / CEA10) TaxID=451804 RepID=B0XU29_ASPFC|nr:conserved hypothetical protein [Aspergillus fumigatus A1163]
MYKVKGRVGAYHAGQNRASRKCPSEGLFIPHTILDNHERGVVVYCRGQLRGYGVLINGLVRADDVVIWMCYFRW